MKTLSASLVKFLSNQKHIQYLLRLKQAFTYLSFSPEYYTCIHSGGNFTINCKTREEEKHAI